MPAILRTLFPDLDLSFHSKSSLIFRKSHSMTTGLHKRFDQVSVTTNDVSWALCFYHSRVGTVKSAVRTDVRCGKGGDTDISPVDAASDGAEVGVAVGSAVRWSLGDNRMGHHSKVNLIIYNTHDILSWFLVVSHCPNSNYRDMLQQFCHSSGLSCIELNDARAVELDQSRMNACDCALHNRSNFQLW